MPGVVQQQVVPDRLELSAEAAEVLREARRMAEEIAERAGHQGDMDRDGDRDRDRGGAVRSTRRGSLHA